MTAGEPTRASGQESSGTDEQLRGDSIVAVDAVLDTEADVTATARRTADGDPPLVSLRASIGHGGDVFIALSTADARRLRDELTDALADENQ